MNFLIYFFYIFSYWGINNNVSATNFELEFDNNTKGVQELRKSLWNLDRSESNFYIVKLGFSVVYIMSPFSVIKMKFCCLVYITDVTRSGSP